MLIFAGTASGIVNQKTQGSETLIGLAASTGLAVMIVILATGHISGAHLNPSVTIAFATLKHFPWKQVGNAASYTLLLMLINKDLMSQGHLAGTCVHTSTGDGFHLRCICTESDL